MQFASSIAMALMITVAKDEGCVYIFMYIKYTYI